MNAMGDIAAPPKGGTGMRLMDIVILDIQFASLAAADIETGIDAVMTGGKESPLIYGSKVGITLLKTECQARTSAVPTD